MVIVPNQTCVATGLLCGPAVFFSPKAIYAANSILKWLTLNISCDGVFIPRFWKPPIRKQSLLCWSFRFIFLHINSFVSAEVGANQLTYISHISFMGWWLEWLDGGNGNGNWNRERVDFCWVDWGPAFHWQRPCWHRELAELPVAVSLFFFACFLLDFTWWIFFVMIYDGSEEKLVFWSHSCRVGEASSSRSPIFPSLLCSTIDKIDNQEVVLKSHNPGWVVPK